MATYFPRILPVSGALNEHISVSAIDLDIRDISLATDNIEVSGVISGNVAHDAIDYAPPVKIGAKAVVHGSSPVAVAAGDVTNVYANRHGIPFFIGGHPNIETLTGKYTAAQTDTVLKSIAAGQKWVTTSIAVFCAGSNVVDCAALIEYDDTPDVRIAEHPGIAAGSGFTWGDGAGILSIGADGQDLLFSSDPTVSGSIVVQVAGFVIES